MTKKGSFVRNSQGRGVEGIGGLIDVSRAESPRDSGPCPERRRPRRRIQGKLSLVRARFLPTLVVASFVAACSSGSDDTTGGGHGGSTVSSAVGPGSTSATASTSGTGASGTSASSGTGGSPACLPGMHVAGGSDDTGGCWPGPNNTGVPVGTTLTNYTGPCVITEAGTVIDGKTIDCDIDVRASDVTIKNSMINGLLVLDTDLDGSSAWSMTLMDSEVDGGMQQRAVVSSGNMTVLRANLHGGITAAQCEEKSVSCTIRDSWLHGQYLPDTANWHLGGFLSDGGTQMTLEHNTVVCDHAVNSVDEGCTGDINFIPNFAPISGASVEHNLLGANADGSYCTYGGEKSSSPTPHSDHIVYQDNVFQRGVNGMCGSYGPVTNFDVGQPGNEWTNNRWDDGSAVDPAN